MLIDTGIPAEERTERYDNSKFACATLSNGIPVWIQEPEFVPSHEGVLLAFLNNVGAICDPIGLEGCAHFFEHIPGRGTENHPFAGSLKNACDKIGASYNWSTSERATKYVYGGPLWHFHALADLLAETTLRPLITPEGVEVELGVILEELTRAKSGSGFSKTPRIREHLFRGLRYHRALGTEESIKRIDASALRAFHESYYHAGNIALVIGGAFAELPRNEVIDQLEKSFGSVAHSLPAPGVRFAPCALSSSERHEFAGRNYRRSSFTRMALFPFTSFRDYIALDLLRDVTRRALAKDLRDKRGIIYETDVLSVAAVGDAVLVNFDVLTDPANFSILKERFVESLSGVSNEDIRERLRGLQLTRPNGFAHPISACKDLPHEIRSLGTYRSTGEWRRTRDTLTYAELHEAKEKLLAVPWLTLEFDATRD